ncbi:MAG: caspase family protein [Kiritimatiellae bacterium]|nr:caspase family protein [Kiritimatiellia bacterium]
MRAAVHSLCILFLCAASVCAAPVAQRTEPRKTTRTAVCIGLGEYQRQNKLRWAETDAVAMARALSKNGYKVICLTRRDATLKRVATALAQEPALVYFAGHYLDSKLQLKDGGLAITDVAQKTRFMLLDCCHAGEDLGDEGGTIAFAAGSGYAFEAGSNGLFTKHLLDWLRHRPGARNCGMVDYVCQRVARETGDWQRPVVGRL